MCPIMPLRQRGIGCGQSYLAATMTRAVEAWRKRETAHQRSPAGVAQSERYQIMY